MAGPLLAAFCLSIALISTLELSFARLTSDLATGKLRPSCAENAVPATSGPRDPDRFVTAIALAFRTADVALGEGKYRPHKRISAPDIPFRRTGAKGYPLY